MTKTSLASQPHSVPQRRLLSVLAHGADTENDRHCGTEWGWLARLVLVMDEHFCLQQRY